MKLIHDTFIHQNYNQHLSITQLLKTQNKSNKHTKKNLELQGFHISHHHHKSSRGKSGNNNNKNKTISNTQNSIQIQTIQIKNNKYKNKEKRVKRKRYKKMSEINNRPRDSRRAPKHR